jgi:hypothetical protein
MRAKKRSDKISPPYMRDLMKKIRHLSGWKKISKSKTIGWLTSDGNFSLNLSAMTRDSRICSNA